MTPEKKTEVYYVEGYDKDGQTAAMAIFSIEAKFDEWASLPENSELAFVVCPFVIDEPDWGNISKRKLS